MTDYYVSVNGRNQNNGTSAGSPWRSIQQGIDALGAGDTLHIMEGTYDPGQEGQDYWQVLNKNGTANNPITIRHHNNEVVRLTGRESGAGSGFPQTRLEVHARSVTYENVTYKLTEVGLLEFKDCSHIIVDGLEVIDSLGEGIRLRGTRQNSYSQGVSGADIHDIVIKNCRIHNTRHRNMRIQNAWQVEIRDCEFSFGSWAITGGGGGPGVYNGYYIHFDNNVFHQQAGEAIVVDGNNFFSRNIYIRNNIMFDCEDPIYLHGVSYVICVGNYIYNTPEELSAPKGFVPTTAPGITVQPSECNKPVQKKTEYVLVAHNIVVNRGQGITAKTYPFVDGKCPNGWESKPLRHVYIAYNTVVNSYGGDNYRIATDTASQCVFKSNISIINSPSNHANTAGRDSKGWDADYNLYSSQVSMPAVLSGSHDIKNKDPQLTGDLNPPSKGQLSVKSAGYYANFNLKDGYDDASGFRLTQNSPAIDAAFKVSAPSGWPEMNEYLNWSFNFNRSGENPRRSDPWDIGAHEFAPESIRVDFSAVPRNGEAPLKVRFTDESTASQPISSWFWDFGDGSISTEQNPQHEFKQGIFSVSLRVASGDLNAIKTSRNYINVAPPEVVAPPPRVTDGLTALYRFDEGNGDVIYDVSGAGNPLDLKIAEPSNVAWLAPGLQIVSPTTLASIGPAEKINDACRESNAVSLELWIKPKNTTQDGPARIVSISRNAHSRNVTIGQGLWGTQPSDLYDVRLRTTERSANGMPSFSSPEGSLTSQVRHVVFTRASSGRARIFINGVIVAEGTIPGDFSTWNPRFPLLIGNETGGDYPWLGEVYLLGIYSRRLSPEEVIKNRDAGRPVQQTIAQPAVTMTMFRRFIIISNGQSLTASKTLAYGVQYPDERCVICASNGSNGMTIYDSVSKAIVGYEAQGARLQWLD